MTEGATHQTRDDRAGDDPLEERVDEGPKGGATTWYDVLEIAIDAAADDVKKAYDRALALVEGRNIGGYLMLDPMAAESARADVEAAFRVLGDAERRKAYDQRLRDQGKAPAPPPPKVEPALPSQKPLLPLDGGKKREDKAPDARNFDDAESRDAREILEVADAQLKRGETTITPAPSASSLASLPDATADIASVPAGEPVSSGEGDSVFKTLPPHLADKPASAPPLKRTTSSPGLKFLAPVGDDPLTAKPTSVIRFEDPKTDDQPPLVSAAESPLMSPTPPSAPPPRKSDAAMLDTTAPMRAVPKDAVEGAPAAAAPSRPPSSPPVSSVSAKGLASAVNDAATQPSAAVPAPVSGLGFTVLPDGDIGGEIIRSLREGRGLTIDGLAEATKIRKPYLKAIEEQDIPNLPARVYLRGFLTQIARVLKVDRARLADGYLACVEKLGAPPT